MRASLRGRGVLRDTFVYGSGTLLSQFISAFRGLLIAGLLGPVEYGLWKSLQVVLDYLAYTHFGVLHGLAHMLPLYRQKNERDQERKARLVSLVVTVLTSVLAGAVLLVVTHSGEPRIWRLWFGIAGLLVLMQLIRYQIMTCQALGRFAVLSAADVTLAVISLAFMWILVPKWGLFGLFAGLGLGCVAALLIGLGKGVYSDLSQSGGREPGEKPKDTNPLPVLLRMGFPFMAVDGLFVVWQRIDRVALIAAFGAESKELGYYGLATMVASFGVQIPQVLMRVLFRRTVQVFEETESGKGDVVKSRQRHLELPWIASACVLPLVFAAGTLGSWWVIGWMLPDYREADLSILILMGATYWCGLGLSVRNLFTARKAQWRLGAIYLVTIGTTWGLSYFLSTERLGARGIAGAGIGMLAGSFLFALLSLADNARGLGWGVLKTARLLYWGLAPFVTWVVWGGTAWRGLSAPLSFESVLLEAGWAVLLNGPWALWFLRTMLLKKG